MTAHNRSRRNITVGRLLLAGALIAISFAVGCHSNKPAAIVELKAIDGAREMMQPFGKAYFSRAERGDYDIVLWEQSVLPKQKAKKGGEETLASIDAVPLNHVIHIKVLWRPKRMIRADSPSATNATIHWTVIAGDDSGAVTYDGVGFADVYGADTQVRVRLQNANVIPVGHRGTLDDPIGRATLSADFKATRDTEAVRTLLANSRDALAEPTQDRSSPPPRPPTP